MLTGKDAAALDFNALLVLYKPVIINKANEKAEPWATTEFDDLYQVGCLALDRCHEVSKGGYLLTKGKKQIDNFDAFFAFSLNNAITNVIGKLNCKRRSPNANGTVLCNGIIPYEEYHAPLDDPRDKAIFNELVEEIMLKLNPEEQKLFKYLINPTPKGSYKHKTRTTVQELVDCVELPAERIRAAILTIKSIAYTVMQGPVSTVG